MEVSSKAALEVSSKATLEVSSRAIQKEVLIEEAIERGKVEIQEGREQPLTLLVSEVSKELITSFDRNNSILKDIFYRARTISELVVESVNKKLIIRQFDRMSSILVIFLLVGSLSADADVVGLLLSHHGELGVESSEMETGHLLIEDLGKFVDGIRVINFGVLIVPEFELGESLVAEGVAHHERRVASGASEVEETA